METKAKQFLEDNADLLWRCFPHTFATVASNGAWLPYKHLAHISTKIAPMILQGNARFIISLPPRHGKSELVSFWLSCWLLDLCASTRVILASYEADYASTWGRKVRNFFESQRGQELTQVRVRDDSHAANRWETTEGGGMVTAGIGGAITGRGGDCLVEGTMVETAEGPIAIERLCRLQSKPKILSYNHKTDRAEWQNIVASRSLRSGKLFEVITNSGRRIVCTADHHFYVLQSGYRAAKDLSPGDKLVAVADLSSMRGEEASEARADLPGLLSRTEKVAGGSCMQLLPKDIRSTEISGREGKAKTLRRCLLFFGLFDAAPCDQKPQALRNLRDAGRKEDKAVLPALQSETNVEAFATKDMSILWQQVRANILSNCLLHSIMRQFRAFQTNGRRRKLALQRRPKLFKAVRFDVAAGSRSRWECLRSLCEVGQQSRPAPSGSPHQRTAAGQPARKSDPSLFDVSCRTPQIEHDAVAMVREIRGGGLPVYDIQVEGNSNFFAGEVLVHNCLLIDDPTKNWVDAMSPGHHRKNEEWFNSTFYTRREPNASIGVIMTRWVEGDLAGYLEKQHPDKWTVIRLPAIAEEDDALGRAPGEALCPERYNVEDLGKIRKSIGPVMWSGLYNQNPTNPEGGIFKRSWFRYWTRGGANPLPERFTEIIGSWDLPFDKEDDAASFASGQIWGRFGAMYYLLDEFHEQVDFPQAQAEIQKLLARWPQCRISLIENKAMGAPIVASLKKTVPGLVRFNPKGSKEARAISVSGIFESGNVSFPHADVHPWSTDFAQEIAAFPRAKLKDRVDAMVQALQRFSGKVLGVGNMDLEQPTRAGIASQFS